MKNIPIPNGKSYKLQLIQKVEDFIKKLRWKAIFFMEGGNRTEPATHKTGLTFGLNSPKCSPQVKELVLFEEDLIKLVKHFRLEKVINKFQITLAKDLKGIQSSKKNFNCSRQNVKYVSL